MINKALWQGHALVSVEERLKSSDEFDMGLKSMKTRVRSGGVGGAVGWKGTCIDTSCNPDVSLQPRDDEMGVVMQGWLKQCGQQLKT